MGVFNAANDAGADDAAGLKMILIGLPSCSMMWRGGASARSEVVVSAGGCPPPRSVVF